MKLNYYLMGILISFMSCATVHAYKIEIFNKTDGILHAKLEYSGKGYCSYDVILLPSNTTRVVSTGGCCAKKVYYTKLTGSNTSNQKSLPKTSIEPPYTGASESCKDSRLSVEDFGKSIVAKK